jgi:heterotetrameric sarcosine oxidase gamma subunit
MLKTIAKLPYQSPITAAAQSVQGVSLTDCSGHGLLDIRGQVILFSALNVGGVQHVENGILARLTHDQLFLMLDADANIADATALFISESGKATVTDVTHGYGNLRLSGWRAVDVLAKVCGLDFFDTSFPDFHAAQTSLAKVRTLILRRDEDEQPTYYLIVSSSLAAYVWGVVQDAMQEFGA